MSARSPLNPSTQASPRLVIAPAAPGAWTRRRWLGATLAMPWAFHPQVAWTEPAGVAGLPALGSRLALIDLPLVEGGTFRAGQAHGQVTVVYWWASWCPFCAEMSPGIEQLWRTQRDRGLMVLGISIDRTIEAAREYRRRRGYTFPSAWHASVGDTALPKPSRVPVLWVRDRSGRVVMAEAGQVFPEDIEQIARFL